MKFKHIQLAFVFCVEAGGKNTPIIINDIHTHLNTYVLSSLKKKEKKKASVSILTRGCVQASPSAVFPSGIVIKQKHSWVGMLI